jgi:hypothetical protein
MGYGLEIAPCDMILSCVFVTKDGVWIGELIYVVTTVNCNTLKITVIKAHKMKSFISACTSHC